MGELNDTVLMLLEACSNGLAIIRRLRRRRKEIKHEIDPDAKVEESRLNRSLKRTMLDVQSAHAAAIRKLGHRFAKGDIKARSSIMSIIRRFKSGFGSVNKLAKGESTRTDYQTLVSLSDVSRTETLDTLKQLSTRLSQSSMTRLTANSRPKSHGSSGSQRAAFTSMPNSRHTNHSNQIASNSAVGKTKPKSSGQQRSPHRQNAPGPRPPNGGKNGSEEAATGKPLPQRPSNPIRPNSRRARMTFLPTVKPPEEAVSSSSVLRSRQVDRRSVISFASDSTKLGEIPCRNTATRTGVAPDKGQYFGRTIFPVTPWKRPEKARSGLLRLFRS